MSVLTNRLYNLSRHIAILSWPPAIGCLISQRRVGAALNFLPNTNSDDPKNIPVSLEIP
jgi:hypothetical protein